MWDCPAEKELLEEERRRLAIRRAHLQQHPADHSFGVALSGGGIRSATFNLGILQALARKNLLPRVDYLSTVSGGGFIGSWLHGLIRNCAAGDPRQAAPFLLPPDLKPHGATVDDPVAFLREYSRYLAPSDGLFSADSWQIFTIWSRNTFLNQLVLIPLLCAASFLMFLTGGLWRLAQQHSVCLGQSLDTGAPLFCLPVGVKGLMWLAGSAILLLVAGSVAARPLREEVHHEMEPQCSPAGDSTRQTFRKGNAVGIAALTLAASAFAALGMESVLLDWNVIGVAGLGVYTLVFALTYFGFCRRYAFSLASAVAGAAALTAFFALSAAVLRQTREWGDMGDWAHLALAPIAGGNAFLLGIAIHMGLMGFRYPDVAREWLSRIGSLVMILMLAWGAAFGLLVFAPWWMMKLALWSATAAGGAMAVWVGGTISGVLAGKSSSTGGPSPPTSLRGRAVQFMTGLVPGFFVAGLLMFLSFGCFYLLYRTGNPTSPHANPPPPSATIHFSLQASTPEGNAQFAVSSAFQTPVWILGLQPLDQAWWAVLSSQSNLLTEFLAFLIAMTLVWVASRQFDINEFSMQRFYSNRLIRCYLGASRGAGRRENAFTGFDPHDEVLLALLSPDGPEPYFGPQPIINCTVNMTKGSKLARLERKGESFVFTPAYCGYGYPGKDAYLNTNMYLNGAVRLGLVTGISGSAANPNWGYHTTPSVAFLLTMFNVRLGWWVGNPANPESREKRGPDNSLEPLFNELTANLTKDSPWLNLSDGGHFENLGLYELIRRRCLYIIVGDGEQDESLLFESLGGAVRKCRADFGVEIDINISRIHAGPGALSSSHCVVGTIRYPVGENLPEGKLLYIKASITGDESADVLQYRTVHTDFPHETTLNQFFTESQFESYRKLGYHAALSALEPAETPLVKLAAVLPPAADPERNLVHDVFARLDTEWYPLDTEISGAANVSHTNTWSRLMNDLFSKSELAVLRPELLPSSANPPQQELKDYDFNDAKDCAIHGYMLELIQLMENVWADTGLDQRSRRHGPQFAGWMRVFVRWAKSPYFVRAWNLAKPDFTVLFHYFIQQLKEEDFPE